MNSIAQSVTGTTPSSSVSKFSWRNGLDPKEGGHRGLPVEVNRVEHKDGMEITWDVPVPMRDGVKLYVDVFKPEGASGQKLPVIFTFSPYGKHGTKSFKSFHEQGVSTGVPEDEFPSDYTAWEAPDPITWTKKGFIVINGDSRGSWGSEGNLEVWGRQEGKDGHDVIEWAAAQPWSNGNVGMMGVSYLAVVQWVIAETNPPHLKCFVPWHGFTDLYRDYSYHGGIPETNFINFTMWSCRCGPNLVEDWIKNHQEHTMLDDYFQMKLSSDLSMVTAPAFVVIDWGDQGMHTRGTINGYLNIGSKEKWLLIHGQKKWRYFYQDSAIAKQEAFFKKYLLGEKSEVDSWPKVEIEVLDRAYRGTFRAENEWPLARTRYTRKYLDNTASILIDDIPTEYSSSSYQSDVEDNCLDFFYNFAIGTEVTGHTRLRLWVSAEKANDMDLFIRLDKIDTKGEVVPYLAFSTSDEGPMALGWLRVSHRELDLGHSSTERPYHTHTRELLLRQDETVPVDIEILASSVHFYPGEKLRLRIQGNDPASKATSNIGQLHQNTRNKGKHFIHSGPLHESYINLPVIPSACRE